MDVNRLHCIDLDQPKLEGFTKFLSAWVYQGDDFTFLVDPGPLSSIPFLVGELRRLGIETLDYILLTHIHIDHAGGTGRLLDHYPAARVICHPDGISHMVEPARLWEGSLKVLGYMAEAYGEIVPVPAASISFAAEIGSTGIKAVLTPGHAQHHLCFFYDDLLFGGEVVGVRSEVPQGIYMRPATPPRFMLDVALESIDRVMALQPRYLVMAHYGLVEPAMEYLAIGRQQLLLWVEGVEETARQGTAGMEDRLFDWLVAHDDVYRNIRQLPPEIFARERYFLKNTMTGMLGYLKSQRPASAAAV
ncbi:MAG: MBL fold metallo-hydrolase [Deltaproteobacteria bacterium]|nr:MBL fold metallo-hydrolase [Candidatus Anaeroferrophillus wilburensis]MBN2888772.1 MBL fold metallo-hydrolase [Deltaproteobacteria bacterium]